MKATTLILVIFLLGMTLVVALGVAGLHSQRSSNQVLERVIDELTERSRSLEDELRRVQGEFARLEAAHREQELKLSAASSAPAVPAGVPVNKPQPFQARAFVGSDYIGMAWVVPGNVKEDAETGEFRFEPVISIDERARKAFTQTNVVEREVYRNNTLNQSWVYQQPYSYGYPVWIKPATGQNNPPPGQRPPPVLPSPGGGTRFWPAVGSPLIRESAGRLLPDSVSPSGVASRR